MRPLTRRRLRVLGLSCSRAPLTPLRNAITLVEDPDFEADEDEEATASESVELENENENDTQTQSMFQSRNTSTDKLTEFGGAAFGQKRKGGGRRGGSITLKLLIDEGLISPGKRVLSVEYKSSVHVADLTDDGKIEVDVNGRHLVFDSPSAFSIYLKRLSNPSRKADDGWKSVRYNGNLLEHYKLELARKKVGDSGGTMEELFPRRAYNKKPKTIVINDPEPPPSPPRAQRNRVGVNDLVGADTKECLVDLRDHDPTINPAPFHLKVSTIAQATIDIHAHLCHDEVVGVLLGTYNHEIRTANVTAAVPIETKAVTDAAPVARVEMDEEDLDKRVKAAMKAGVTLQLLGTYHSHPDFAARPTRIDVVHAVRDELRARREGTDAGVPMNPQIHCIVSPYNRDDIVEDDRAVESAPCTWWHVAVPSSMTALDDNADPISLGCTPYKISQMVMSGLRPENDEIMALSKTVENLAKQYAQSETRANIMGLWRKTDQGRVILRLRKLIQSFEAKLKKGTFDGKLRSFTQNKLEVLLKAVWSVYGPQVGDGDAAGATAGASSAPDASANAPAVAATDEVGSDEEEELSELTE